LWRPSCPTSPIRVLAHSQLVKRQRRADQADLQGKPASNISRLVCPRRLRESCLRGCVVPAFEPGGCRLGLVSDENAPAMTTLAPA